VAADPKLIPIGLSWCWEEDYDAFVAIFEDSNDLPRTWKEFIRPYEQAEKEFQASGKIVKRIYINPRTFPSWCASKGYRVNAKARERFAAEIAIKEQRNAGGSW
jgi:hypothetical protein